MLKTLLKKCRSSCEVFGLSRLDLQHP